MGKSGGSGRRWYVAFVGLAHQGAGRNVEGHLYFHGTNVLNYSKRIRKRGIKKHKISDVRALSELETRNFLGELSDQEIKNAKRHGYVSPMALHR